MSGLCPGQGLISSVRTGSWEKSRCFLSETAFFLSPQLPEDTPLTATRTRFVLVKSCHEDVSPERCQSSRCRCAVPAPHSVATGGLRPRARCRAEERSAVPAVPAVPTGLRQRGLGALWQRLVTREPSESTPRARVPGQSPSPQASSEGGRPRLAVTHS